MANQSSSGQMGDAGQPAQKLKFWARTLLLKLLAILHLKSEHHPTHSLKLTRATTNSQFPLPFSETLHSQA